MNGQCDPYATVALAGPCRQVPCLGLSGELYSGAMMLRPPCFGKCRMGPVVEYIVLAYFSFFCCPKTAL